MSDSQAYEEPEPSADPAGQSLPVARGGLVYVNEGERIVVPPGAAAAVAASTGGEVHCYFPIKVVVAGSGPEATADAIPADVYGALYGALT
ncbi:hypothetical protein ACPC54_39830 [Kitasatospora sp. NPDC094028]